VKWERVAPAQVNLLGEHTDSTGGMVLPMFGPELMDAFRQFKVLWHQPML
jgi:hypothetical protein